MITSLRQYISQKEDFWDRVKCADVWMRALLQSHENNRETNSEAESEVWHFEEERRCRIMWPVVGTQTRRGDLLLLALIILTQRRQRQQ